MKLFLSISLLGKCKHHKPCEMDDPVFEAVGEEVQLLLTLDLGPGHDTGNRFLQCDVGRVRSTCFCHVITYASFSNSSEADAKFEMKS